MVTHCWAIQSRKVKGLSRLPLKRQLIARLQYSSCDIWRRWDERTTIQGTEKVIRTDSHFRALAEHTCHPDVSILLSAIDTLRKAAMASGFPTVFIATTSEPDVVAPELLTVFKQEVEIKVCHSAGQVGICADVRVDTGAI